MTKSTLCSAVGCEKAVFLSTLCKAHYHRLKRHGSPYGGNRNRGEVSAFLDDVIFTQETDECILWPFSKNVDGYGTLCIDYKSVLAHRIVCERSHGPTPDIDGHYEVAHRCGIPQCVNKRHLRWATRSENQMDRIVHGTDSRGEKSGRCRLRESQVRSIFSDGRSVAAIAEEYHVSKSAITSIKNGSNWRHLQLFSSIKGEEA